MAVGIVFIVLLAQAGETEKTIVVPRGNNQYSVVVIKDDIWKKDTTIPGALFEQACLTGQAQKLDTIATPVGTWGFFLNRRIVWKKWQTEIDPANGAKFIDTAKVLPLTEDRVQNWKGGLIFAVLLLGGLSFALRFNCRSPKYSNFITFSGIFASIIFLIVIFISVTFFEKNFSVIVSATIFISLISAYLIWRGDPEFSKPDLMYGLFFWLTTLLGK